jgi:putative ABC transport system permease protein
MGILWYKIWYDLWRNKLRTLLVVISISMGVFAVGTTFGMTGQLLPTMDAAHQSTSPSHVTIYPLQPVPREVIIALEKVPGVQDVEALNGIEVRYKINPGDKWRKGNILMRDDYEYQLNDIVQLKAGAWPEGDGLSIERMHSPFYGIDIGDEVIFKVGEQEQAFPITGKIRHPFVPPPSMYDMAWFFSGPQVMEKFGIPQNSFNQIKLRVDQYSPDRAREVASAVKERLAKQGIGVYATMYQDPTKHWGRAFVDGQSLVLQVLAVLSMLLSVVLVLNTLTAVITQQTNQIGILKAIGGTGFAITRIYLTVVLVYGLLSLCVALPLGALTSFSASRFLLGMYNIEFDTFSFPAQAIGFQILAAIGVPLIAALIPVSRGSTITVRQAIASYGLGGDFGSSWIDRLVEKIGRRFLSSFYAIALANTFRRKGRLLLTQLVLIIAGIMFLMVMSLSSSMKTTLDAEFGRRTHDVIMDFEDFQRVDRTSSLAETVEGVEKASMWMVVPVTILRQGQKTMDAGMGSQLQGVPVDDPMYVPLVVEGRWLQPGDGRVIVMNKQTADDENIRLGDKIRLDLGEWGHTEWQVIGLYRVFLFFGGGYSIDAIYAPRSAVYDATNKSGKASTLLVRAATHSEADVNNVVTRLEDLFKHEHIEVVRTETLPALRKTSDTAFALVISMLLALAVIIALVGGIGLMGSLWISVIERTKEIGILRSIGARSHNIIGMFVLEGLIQGALSWGLAVPLSIILTPLMSNALGQALFQSNLDYKYNFSAAAIWFLIIAAISVFAAIVPARIASKINIRQTLAYE